MLRDEIQVHIFLQILVFKQMKIRLYFETAERRWSGGAVCKTQ